MSGQWPPGWEDPEDFADDAEEQDTDTVTRLSEVTAYLASVPAPVLPDAIEARIGAALAVESAARAPQADSSAQADQSRTLGPPPARARVRRRRRLSAAMVAGPLLACLLFAGLGFVISRGGSSSSSSAPSAAGAGPVPAAASASSSSAAQGYSAGSSRAAAGATAKTPFGLDESGTRYLAATLVSQVRAELAAKHTASSPASVVVPAASASSSSAVASTSAAPASSAASATGSTAGGSRLHDCVVHFTRGAAPQLIDKATYQGTPVYVIADSNHVWVVGRGCTAAHPELIASASLAG